jgi:hypothetical protein
LHRVFGIRHHGPGSALRLREALHQYQPDLVLVEGPPEGNPLLETAEMPALKPPLAILVYNPKALKQASFYPFARFSPEWVAIEHAQEVMVPVRFIDLSLGARWPEKPPLGSAGPAANGRRAGWLRRWRELVGCHSRRGDGSGRSFCRPERADGPLPGDQVLPPRSKTGSQPAEGGLYAQTNPAGHQGGL